MKKCHRCGTRWEGYGANPRPREVCEGCGAYLHCCVNCLHFDHVRSNSCKLKYSTFIGSRTALNYCEHFRMANTVVLDAQAKVERAKDRWESLWK